MGAKRKPKPKGVFVACDNGTFLCSDCIPPEIDLGDPAVEVWTEGSDGWLAPVVCATCKLSIPVYVNGVEAEVEAPRANEGQRT